MAIRIGNTQIIIIIKKIFGERDLSINAYKLKFYGMGSLSAEMAALELKQCKLYAKMKLK